MSKMLCSALLLSIVSYGATIGGPPPLTAVYEAYGDAILQNGQGYIFNGDVFSPTLAKYSDFYNETFTFNGVPITSNLAKVAAYAEPGSMGIFGFVGGPAVGPVANVDNENVDAAIFEQVAPSNGQLTGTISVNYFLHGSVTTTFGQKQPNAFGSSAQITTAILSTTALNLDSFGALGESVINASSQQTTVSDSGYPSGVAKFPIVNGIATIEINIDSFLKCSLDIGPQAQTCQAVADFYNTFNLGGAQIYDASGNFEPDVTLISASGFDYNAPIAASEVPEPRPIALFVLGIITTFTIMPSKRSRSLN